jgi:probable F420-dependent oxidoreductase
MRIGVVFPHSELGPDPGAIKAYAQASEELGYNHVVTYDHVLGTTPTDRPDYWESPAYMTRTQFHEPFVLLGYLAAVTKRIELVTAIVILPQRQTVLVAKQAAELDVLSEGRLRLGIGIGWNPVEYEALGENFHDRGLRSEEQVEVLRALWSQERVTYEGKWHHIVSSGLSPMPVQRPIPIWFGGGSTDAVVQRIARLGDGWFPLVRTGLTNQQALDEYRRFAQEAGRDPTALGIETQARMMNGIDEAVRHARDWEALGVTHLAVNTMGAGYQTADEHIEALRRFKEAMG